VAEFKTLVYSPDCQAIIATDKGMIDLSPDLVSGNIQRNGDGVSFAKLTMANKGLRYTNSMKRMDRIVIRMRRLSMWVTVFSGYLNSVPVVNLYPGTVTITASCTLKRLKYTYWDPGLAASAALFDQMGTDLANGGDNKDAGLGFMLKNILFKVGGWEEDQVKVQDFPTSFVTYLEEATKNYEGKDAEAVKQFKALFDYDEATGSTGGSGGAGGGTGLGPLGQGQKFYVSQILGAADERSLGDDGAAIGVATGLVESELRILANTKVPESYNFPHDGEGSDGTSCGIFQQQQNGAWGTLAENMNALGSARLFFNALQKFDWKSMDPGMAAQRVQGSAYPEKYGARMAEARQIVADSRAAGKAAPGAPTNTSTTPAPSGGGAAAPAAPAGATAAGGGNMIDSNTLPPSPWENDHIQPDTRRWLRVVHHKWPEISDIGTYRESDPYPDHPSGRAADTMIPNYAANIPLGDAIRDFAHANAGALGLQYTIWQQEYWGDDARNIMEDRGGDTANHRDHVHLTFIGNAGTGGMLDGSTSGGAPAAGGGGATAGSSFQNKLAKNLFGYLFDPSTKYAGGISEMFTGELASVNDEPLIETVRAICNARMCNFQSAPSGEFLAYYPDYFGLDGSPAVLNLEDIELKNFGVDLNDDRMVTHMFTAGTYQAQGTQGVQDLGWLRTAGIATVENEWLFKRMMEASIVTPDTEDTQAFLERYGIRPLKEQFSNIRGTDWGNGAIEIMLAAQRFMQHWAEQTLTTVSFTFMPDLYPGMRVNLVGHGVTVYVDSVNHTFDFESGGFQTTASIMAPSKTGQSNNSDISIIEGKGPGTQ
jgi:hypothetical protein